MKGGIASLLTAACSAGKTQGLTLLFDCDEEYAFAGINQLIRGTPLSAQLLVCPEPTGLQLISSCSSLFEFRITVAGKTAHASTPDRGTNAIEKTIEVINQLKQLLGDGSSVNLAYLTGGLQSNNRIKNQPNAVADMCQFTLDIRAASQWLAADITPIIESLSAAAGLTIKQIQTTLNYPGFDDSKVIPIEVRKMANQLRSPALQPGGYYEAALTSRNWGIPSIVFGPTGTPHAADEYVTIDSLKQCEKVYAQLIRRFC
jgi:succinyl-diaminopimelate desuccinylase